MLRDEEQEQGQEQQSQEEGVIIRVSKEQIRELSRHAQSSSRIGKPSESGPFNLRSNKPIYSNDFGNFYEISPGKNPQLKDLELSLTCAEINEVNKHINIHITCVLDNLIDKLTIFTLFSIL